MSEQGQELQSVNLRESVFRKELEYLAGIMELEPKPKLGQCDWHRLAKGVRKLLEAHIEPASPSISINQKEGDYSHAKCALCGLPYVGPKRKYVCASCISKRDDK